MRSQALTAVLELLSLGAVRAVCRKKGGAKLGANPSPSPNPSPILSPDPSPNPSPIQAPSCTRR